MSKSIFITGATGFVGAAMVRHFAALGHPVLATSRSTAPPRLLDVAQYHQADLTRPLASISAEVVVHAAALASDAAAWTDLARANLDGTRHVYEATRNCPCFVYISSSSVYDPRRAMHTEDEPVETSLLSPYGRSKYLAEQWLLEQDWTGRSLYILRPRAIYGPGDRVLLPRLMRLVRGGRIVSPGSMAVQSSLTHVGNLCQAVMACVQHHQPGTRIFNVADAQPYAMNAVVQRLLSDIYGQPLDFLPLPLGPLRAVARVLYTLGLARQFTPQSLAAVSADSTLNTRKIGEMMGFEPHFDFWNSAGEIANWAKTVGIERVKNADSDLCWSC